MSLPVTMVSGLILLVLIGGIALGPALKHAANRKLAITLAIMFGAGSLAIYALTGSPSAIGLSDERREDMRQAQQAVADQPDNAQAWDHLSRLYRLHGFPNEALKATEAALRIDPASATRLGDMAEALMMQSSPDEPQPPILQETVDKGLELDPSDARLRFIDARLAAVTGDTDRSIAGLTALAQDEDAPPLWRQRAFVALPEAAQNVGPDRIRNMVEGLAARLEAQDGPVEDWARLANALSVLGQHERAAQTWARVASKLPDSAAPLLAKARALRQAAGEAPDSPEIIALLDQALEREPENFEAGWLKALHLARNGQGDTAEQMFNTLLNSLPADDPNRVELAKLRDVALANSDSDTTPEPDED
ncbi:MAG: hypothetical protein Alpg2KO_21680 [Alphaproteobacteria bacterium]